MVFLTNNKIYSNRYQFLLYNISSVKGYSDVKYITLAFLWYHSINDRSMTSLGKSVKRTSLSDLRTHFASSVTNHYHRTNDFYCERETPPSRTCSKALHFPDKILRVICLQLSINIGIFSDVLDVIILKVCRRNNMVFRCG